MKLIQKLIFLRQVVTPRKVLNLLMKEIQRCLRQTHLIYYPNKLTIDIGNVCNLRCPLCPTGRGDDTAKRGLMGMEAFKKVVDELGGYLTHLELYNWGEPLLNRDLIPMVRYAKSKKIPVSISTNLNLLDETMAEALLATKIEKIFISCDGASPKTYGKYRIGGDFEKVLSHLHLLKEAKKKLKNHYTRLILLFHVFRFNEDEIDQIKVLARDLGLELRINKMRTDMGKEVFEKVQDSIERDEKWIPRNPQYSAFDLNQKKKKKPTTCTQLWTTSVINWDGAVFPCCAVYGDAYAFGNALKEPFALIWNNPSYRSARAEVLHRIKESPTICHICKGNDFLHF